MATNRIENFYKLRFHPLRCKEFKSFTNRELDFAHELIERCAAMDSNEWIQFLNRYQINDLRVRSSKRTQLWGCLHEAATVEVPKVKRRK